jgi:hypothetical protein
MAGRFLPAIFLCDLQLLEKRLSLQLSFLSLQSGRSHYLFFKEILVLHICIVKRSER